MQRETFAERLGAGQQGNQHSSRGLLHLPQRGGGALDLEEIK